VSLDILIAALIAVESGGRDTAIGDGGKAIGPLQIHRSVVQDVNRLTGASYQWQRMTNRSEAISVCKAYLTHYGKGKISRGGALLSHENKKLIDIKDGTSSTIGVAEQSDFCVDAGKAKIDCRSDFGHSFAMGPGPALENRHWNITSVRYRINDKTWENKGVSEVFYGQNRPLQSAHIGGINAVFMDGGVRFLTDIPCSTDAL